MARYFHYKTSADLQDDITRLGLSLTLQANLQPLFQPTYVGAIRVGNRLCIQPMEGCDANPDGTPAELTFRRYRRFGAGGAKLIWGEAAAVTAEARANPRQLLATHHHVDGLRKIVETSREAHRELMGSDDDLLLGLQLTHSGRYSCQRLILACHDPLLDPRTVVDKETNRTVSTDHPLITDDELLQLQDHYVEAAKAAHAAGFQFVDIKQCHRYLLNELLSARSRPGRYGGSYENRTRFAREVFQRIRQDVPGLMLATRLNIFDGLPYSKSATEVGVAAEHTSPLTNSWGMEPTTPSQPDLSEPLRWVADMRGLGVALVNLTLGNPYASPHYLRPFEHPPPDGYATPEHPLIGVARHIRLAGLVQASQPDLPCVGSGYSWLQDFLFQVGAAQVAAGRITFVGVGRASLANPDFAKQLMETGQLDRRRVCRTFSYCTALMRSKHHPLGQFETGCPPFDKDVYMPIWKAAKGK
jgi:NADPH2 dehydrogenase